MFMSKAQVFEKQEAHRATAYDLTRALLDFFLVGVRHGMAAAWSGEGTGRRGFEKANSVVDSHPTA